MPLSTLRPVQITPTGPVKPVNITRRRRKKASESGTLRRDLAAAERKLKEATEAVLRFRFETAASNAGFEPALLTATAFAATKACWDETITALRTRTEPEVIRTLQTLNPSPAAVAVGVGLPVPEAFSPDSRRAHAILLQLTHYAIMWSLSRAR